MGANNEAQRVRVYDRGSDAVVDPDRVDGGHSSENLTNYTDDWGQLDGQISYDLMDEHMQATLSAQNILDKGVEPHTTGALPLGWSKFGTRVSLGLTYKLE